MTFPRATRTLLGAPMVTTGRRMREDGTTGCLIGYATRDQVSELARLRELDRWEPRFSKAVLDRDYPLKDLLREE